ncbi:MAG: GFA family protein [Devosia sp.]
MARCYACHCTDCQRRSGSAFALILPVNSAHFAATGKVVAVEQPEGHGRVAKLHACPTCLTRLFTTNPAWPGVTMIRVGTLDDTQAVRPAFHIWTRSKQPWVLLPSDVPHLETEPSDLNEWRALLG